MCIVKKAVQIHLTWLDFDLQFSKSFKAAWGTRRRTVVLTSLRFRRGRATASPSRICPETWSFPRTARTARSWRPTRCPEDATRSVRCWRRPDSTSCPQNPLGKDTFLCGWWWKITWGHSILHSFPHSCPDQHALCVSFSRSHRFKQTSIHQLVWCPLVGHHNHQELMKRCSAHINQKGGKIRNYILNKEINVCFSNFKSSDTVFS